MIHIADAVVDHTHEYQILRENKSIFLSKIQKWPLHDEIMGIDFEQKLVQPLCNKTTFVFIYLTPHNSEKNVIFRALSENFNYFSITTSM